MSKWFGFIVVAVSLAALAANATLFWCMEQNKKAIQEIKKLEISLPVDLHKKIDDRLKTAVEKIENDIKTKTDKINSNFQNKFTDLSNNQATLNSQLAQAMQNNINHSNTLTEMLKRESTYLKGQMENSRQKYEASVQDSLREYKKQNTIMLSNMKGIVQKHHSDLAKHFIEVGAS